MRVVLQARRPAAPFRLPGARIGETRQIVRLLGVHKGKPSVGDGSAVAGRAGARSVLISSSL